MRNLAVTRRYQVFEDGAENEFHNLCCFTHGKDHLLVYDWSNAQLLRFNPKFLTFGDRTQIDPMAICQVQYVSEMDLMFLAATDGTFFQTRNDVIRDGNYSELFKYEQGIEKFAVSPDCRRVAILSKKRTLLLLTLPELECLVVHELSSTLEEVVVCDIEKCTTGSIAWRKDSRYFAINVSIFSDACTSKREIQIYDEDGTLYSKSKLEEFEILNNVLAWQPSGGLVTTYGKSPHGNAIIFLELNGLKRSHVQLQNTREVVNVSWNSGSDILCVQYPAEIELWIRSNYVWMLKKILTYGKHSSQHQPVRYCNWDPDLPFRFHAVYDNYYVIYDLTRSYNSGMSAGSAIVVSWNGNKIYCTPFRDNSAPPPYGFLQTTLSSNIVEILVTEFWDGFLCITLEGLVLLRRVETSLTVEDVLPFPENFLLHEVDGWAWPNFSTLCCTCNGILKRANLSLTSDTTENASTAKSVTFVDENLIKDVHLLRLLSFSHNQKETDELLVETLSNSLLRINLETKLVTTVLSPRVFSCCNCTLYYLNLENEIVILLHDPHTRQLFISSSEHYNSEPLKISADCVSLAIFCDTVLLTTSSSLEIFNKSLVIELLKQQATENDADVAKILENKFSRKVEKGAVIVSCCVNRMLEPSLTLQILPRGNLEIICPRPLLISTIRSTLRNECNLCNDKGYEKIMNAVRRHRLDYKVLIDEMKDIENTNPASTLYQSLKMMVDQVKDSHSLVLLVTDLDEEYEDCIRIIKDLLEPYLQNQIERKLNIEEAYLASLAKLGLLEEALLSHLIQGEHKDNRNVVTHRVKFLSYYCSNQDILFDTALGTYDLGLASLVADCLGKDPKEYVPILDELNQCSDFKRKFKIDDKLRRYSKAITYLIHDPSTEHTEVLKYMERHRLFTDVICCIQLELCGEEKTDSRSRDNSTTLLRESQISFGSYLEEHTKLREAMILYREGNQLDKAIECAVKCGEWENALDIFYSRAVGTTDLKTLCDHILDDLEGRKNYSGAARLCEVYLSDISRAIGYWIRAHKWTRARSLSHLLEKPEEDIVRLKLVEAANERMDHLVKMTGEITQHFRRWQAVKDIKAKRQLEGGVEDWDNFSDTDSMSSYSSTRSGSSASGKSHRTGKNKRKQDRKLYSMKEGSVHEDLGITAHLWTTFDKIQQEYKPETTKLIASLWEFNFDQLAKDVGAVFDQLLIESGNAIKEIWASVLLEDLIEMKYRIPPSGWSNTWDKLCLHDPSSKAMKL